MGRQQAGGKNRKPVVQTPESDDEEEVFDLDLAEVSLHSKRF